MMVLAVSFAGCAQLTEFVPSIVPATDQPKPASGACQVVTQWSNRVHYEPDPTNGGVLTPGIIGRMYLFDSEVKDPLVGDGSIIVSLFDDSNSTSSEKPIEIWCIDPDTLHRLLRKDLVGQGYTLVLPWTTYRREITNVHMTVRYDPKQGAPLFSPSAPLTLEHPPAPKTAGSPEVPPGVPPIGKPARPVPFVQP